MHDLRSKPTVNADDVSQNITRALLRSSSLRSSFYDPNTIKVSAQDGKIRLRMRRIARDEDVLRCEAFELPGSLLAHQQQRPFTQSPRGVCRLLIELAGRVNPGAAKREHDRREAAREKLLQIQRKRCLSARVAVVARRSRQSGFAVGRRRAAARVAASRGRIFCQPSAARPRPRHRTARERPRDAGSPKSYA